MKWSDHILTIYRHSQLITFIKLKAKLGMLFGFILSILLLSTSIIAQDIQNIGEKQPLKISGSLSTTLNNSSSSNPSHTIPPFAYYLSGNVNLSIYGVSLPFSYNYSKRNSNVAHPFYRLGASPEYKWAKLHLGYRSIRFSKFTLGGHNFLGAGLELNPGLLRIGGVYGRFAKKVLPTIDNPQDTIAGFSRKGYALKLGVGKKDNFFDMIFMHVGDDINTLSENQFDQAKNPEANSVFGVHSKLLIAKKVKFEAEAAVSAFTNDIFAEDIDESDIENATLSKLAEKLNVNRSSYYSMAIASKLHYTRNNFSVGVSYRRIDPGYKSLGAYYFSGDLENITLDTRFKLLDKKLSIKGSVGIQNNNLKENKKSTTDKLISKVNFTFKPTQKFGISGNFTNYSIDQKPGRLPLNDTVKLYRVNNNFSLNPYLLFAGQTGSSTISLNLSSSKLTDNNPNTSTFTEVNSKIAFLNFSRNQKRFGLNYSLGLSYNNMQTYGLEHDAFGVSSSVSKSFIDNKLRIGISGSVSRNNRNDDAGWINRVGLNSTYRIKKKHMIRLRFHFTDVNYPVDAIAKSYNRHRSTFSYSLKF